MKRLSDRSVQGSEFLRKIGVEDIKKYGNIDKLFVPPLEYDQIKQTLNEDKIIFITGTKEYGKTYTAIRLLWEFFNKGYEPVWVKERSNDARFVLNSLLDIEKYLRPHNIVYFEDPFGKTLYDALFNNGLTRDISNIIDKVKNTEDTYVIVTSRDEVFKEFESRITAEIDLSRFQKRLIIKKPSYNEEQRSKMLLNWSTILNCKWFQDPHLVDLVVDRIRNEDKLPTPLNIEQFAYATINVEEEERLFELIKAKSIETARSFAEEIKNMSEDKILFLSFLSISDFKLNVIESMYYKLALELGLEKPQRFEEIKDWFQEDKVLIREGTIGFSHVSFNEAWEFVLNKKGYSQVTSVRIFAKVLSSLLKVESFRKVTENAIIKNIEYLPSYFVSILKERLGRERARRSIMESLLINNRFYDHNPLDVLSSEDRFLLYCVIRGKPNKKIVVSEYFNWNKIVKNLPCLEKNLNYVISDKLLLAISSNPKLIRISIPYSKTIFDNLVESEVKTKVREIYFMATEDLYSAIANNSRIATIRRKFQFEEWNWAIFVELLEKLQGEGFIFCSKSGKLLRSAGKLKRSVKPRSQLRIEERVLRYIKDLIRYLEIYGPMLETRALSYARKVENHPLLDGHEPLHKAAMLVFVASQCFKIPKIRGFLYDESGVNRSYISEHLEVYEKILFPELKH